jgi:hypothetical protein
MWFDEWKDSLIRGEHRSLVLGVTALNPWLWRDGERYAPTKEVLRAISTACVAS